RETATLRIIMDRFSIAHRTREFHVPKYRTLHNFGPPATESEIQAGALQFVRKLSGGFTHPSRSNERAFNRAVEQVALAARELLDTLVTDAPSRNRLIEAAKARARAAERFSRVGNAN